MVQDEGWLCVVTEAVTVSVTDMVQGEGWLLCVVTEAVTVSVTDMVEGEGWLLHTLAVVHVMFMDSGSNCFTDS